MTIGKERWKINNVTNSESGEQRKGQDTNRIVFPFFESGKREIQQGERREPEMTQIQSNEFGENGETKEERRNEKM